MSGFDNEESRPSEVDLAGRPPLEEGTKYLYSEFEVELSRLLNRHCKENASGTPDHILADFLIGCLEAWDKSVARRAVWRGENHQFTPQPLGTADECMEDPGEEPIKTEPPTPKTVPLVIYTDGQRNEIGTAQVTITPGEMAVKGVITGTVGIFEESVAEGQYSISVNETKKDDSEALHEEALNAFQRYQNRGLTGA